MKGRERSKGQFYVLEEVLNIIYHPVICYDFSNTHPAVEKTVRHFQNCVAFLFMITISQSATPQLLTRTPFFS